MADYQRNKGKDWSQSDVSSLKSLAKANTLDGVYGNPDTLPQQPQRVRIPVYHLIYYPSVCDLPR